MIIGEEAEANWVTAEIDLLEEEAVRSCADGTQAVRTFLGQAYFSRGREAPFKPKNHVSH